MEKKFIKKSNEVDGRIVKNFDRSEMDEMFAYKCLGHTIKSIDDYGYVFTDPILTRTSICTKYENRSFLIIAYEYGR